MGHASCPAPTDIGLIQSNLLSDRCSWKGTAARNILKQSIVTLIGRTAPPHPARRRADAICRGEAPQFVVMGVELCSLFVGVFPLSDRPIAGRRTLFVGREESRLLQPRPQLIAFR